MAYKFQLGKAKLSGSVETTQGITSNGGLLVTGSVDLPAASIQTAELTDLNVTAVKLAADAVETAKILNGAVTNDKLAGSIANAKLSNSTISGKELGASLDTLSAATNGGLSTFSYDGSGAVTVALTSSIAGAGLAYSAGVLSVDTAEIAAGLSGSVEAMIGAFVEGSDFVTFDDVNGTIGVDADKFSGSFSAALATKSTTNLAEGTNLYYTEARVRGAVGADGQGIQYASGTGVFSLDLSGTALQKDANGLRTNISVNKQPAFSNGDVLFDNDSGELTFKPVEEAWVRQRLSAVDAVKYNIASGSISLLLTGSSLFQNASGLQVQQSWVRDQFSNGAGLDYSAGVFSVGTGDITNAMLAGAIATSKLVSDSVTINGTAGEVTVVGSPLTLGGIATVSLPSTISKNLTFTGQVTMENLNITGTLTTVNATNLEIFDRRILMASGSTAFAADVGIDFGSHVGHATLLTADVTMGGVAGVDSLSSSLPLVAPAVKAETFYGNFVGASILGIETISAATADISANVTRANAASQVLTLPASPAVGQEHRIKCVVADASDLVIVIKPATGGKIEGVVNAQITLESFGAAVSLVYGGSTEGWMVF
jgi:hypothetical protein